MKRYLLFIYSEHPAFGGWDDFEGDYDSVDDLLRAVVSSETIRASLLKRCVFPFEACFIQVVDGDDRVVLSRREDGSDPTVEDYLEGLRHELHEQIAEAMRRSKRLKELCWKKTPNLSLMYFPDVETRDRFVKENNAVKGKLPAQYHTPDVFFSDAFAKSHIPEDHQHVLCAVKDKDIIPEIINYFL